MTFSAVLKNCSTNVIAVQFALSLPVGYDH